MIIFRHKSTPQALATGAYQHPVTLIRLGLRVWIGRLAEPNSGQPLNVRKRCGTWDVSLTDDTLWTVYIVGRENGPLALF